jgi:hypothetical protein
VTHLIERDLQQLEKMKTSYKQLSAKLNGPLSYSERQILEVSLYMLLELMAFKTKDIKRRLRERRKY